MSRASSLLLAPLAALLAAPLAAQSDGALAGRVRDAASGLAIAEALVTVEGGRRGATTDTAGAFRVRQLRSGSYDVRVRRIGYRPLVLTGVTVRAGATTDLELLLEPQAVEVEDLVVEAPVDPVLDPLAVRSEQRIEARDLRTLPVSSLNEALALTAGSVGESYRGGRVGQTAFVLDGLGVKNQLDASTGGLGLRIPPDILQEASLVTNGFSARYGQAISGVVNVVTRDGGERWTGRLAYETDRPLGGRGDLGLDRLVLAADGPLVAGITGLVGIDLNARTDFDPVNAPAAASPRDPFVDLAGPLPHNSGEQLSFAGKLTIPLSQRQTLRIFGLKSIEQRLLYDPAYKYEPSFGPARRTDGTLLTAHLQHTSSPTASLPIVADLRVGRFIRDFVRGTLDGEADYGFGAFSGDRYRMVGEDRARAQDTAGTRAPIPGFGTPRLTDRSPWGVPAFFLGGASRGEIAWNRFNETRAQLDVTLGTSQGGDTYLGAEIVRQGVVTYQRVSAGLPVGFGDSVPPATASDFTPLSIGLYAESQLRVSELAFTVGMRYDRFDTRADLPAAGPAAPDRGAKGKFSPRFAVSTVFSGVTFVASGGQFVQPPDYQFLVDAAFDDSLRTGRFRQGNPSLGFESSWQYEFSLRGRPREDMALRANVYVKRLDGLVSSVPLGVDPDSSVFGNTDFGSVKGLELLAERTFDGRWGVRALYTLQFADASSTSPFLLRRAFTIDPVTGDTLIPARIEFPLDFDRRHALTLIAQAQVPERVGPSVLGARPFAGWEVATVIRANSGLPFSRIAPGTDSIIGRVNDNRLPWTSTVDVLLRRPVRLGGTRTSLYLDVRNLLNTRNRIGARRDTGTEFATDDDIEARARAAYGANPGPIPFESPRYRPFADLNDDGVIAGENELLPLYRAAARDISSPLLFYGPPRLVRFGMEVLF